MTNANDREHPFPYVAFSYMPPAANNNYKVPQTANPIVFLNNNQVCTYKTWRVIKSIKKISAAIMYLLLTIHNEFAPTSMPYLTCTLFLSNQYFSHLIPNLKVGLLRRGQNLRLGWQSPSNMAKNFLLKPLIAAMLLLCLPNTGPANAQTPFTCSNVAYQVGAAIGGTSTLYSYNVNTGTRTSIANLGYLANAIGYNSLDNLIWGYNQTTDNVVRIDANGVSTSYNIPNLPNSGYHTGAVMTGGYLLLYVANAARYYIVDINPARPATYLKLVEANALTTVDAAPYGTAMSPALFISDFAYSPVTGMLYAIVDVSGSNQFKIATINPATGAVSYSATLVAGANIQQESQAFGSQFIDVKNNTLYVFANAQGRFYKINLTTYAAVLLSTPGALANNDGTNCPSAEFVLEILGTVYNDANGLSDNAVNGTPLGNPSGTALYANLLNAAGTTVIASVQVDNNGNYALPVSINTSYQVQISIVQGVASSATPATSLPAGWTQTGDVIPGGTATASTPGISATIAIGTNGAGSVNFGITQKPTAVNDNSTGNVPATTVTLNPLTNDVISVGKMLDATTVSLVAGSIPGSSCITTDAQADCMEVLVPGQGRWTVNATTGEVSFIPLVSFVGSPTSIGYTVKDNLGLISNQATISIDYAQCQYVTNGTFTTNLTGWTAGTGWAYNNGTGGRAQNGVDGVSNSSLSQTLTSVSNGTYTLSMTLGALNFSTGGATLVVILNGTTYATFVNPTGSAVITGTASNSAVINGFALTAGAGSYVSDDFTITIPYAGTSTPLLEFRMTAGTDDYYVDNVTFEGVCPVQISGTVFNDVNGNTVIDGAEAGAALGTTLFAYLVNSSGVIVGSNQVAADGTYSLTATRNATFTVKLSTAVYTIGTSPAINTAPPAAFVTIGENGNNNTGSGDLAPDGTLSVAVVNTSKNNQNFALAAATLAVNDNSSGNIPGTPVTIDPLNNDVPTVGRTLDATSVSLVASSIPGATCTTIDAQDDCISVTVPAQGSWGVNPTTGMVTFTPLPTFTGDPSPISYTAKDNTGFKSNQATITIDYAQTSTCQFVSNGNFAFGQTAWNGWGGWTVASGRAQNFTDNSTQTINQNLTGLGTGNLTLSMKLGAQNSGTGGGSLTVKLNGTLYATFVNPTNSAVVTATGSNGAAINGFSLVSGTGSFAVSNDFTITFPYSGPANAVLEYTMIAGADDFFIDDIVLSGNCGAPVNCDAFTNGNFSAGAAGWSTGAGWAIETGDYMYNFLNGASGSSVNQTLNNVPQGPLVLNFSVGANNCLANSSQTASLELKLDGVTYATFNNANGANPTTITSTTANGATLSNFGITFNYNGGPLTWSHGVTLNIPNYTGSSNPLFEAVFSSGGAACGDDFGIDNLSLSTCQPFLSGTVFNDINGSTDADVNGTGTLQYPNEVLYANLLNSSGFVIATAVVNTTTGIYSFPNVTFGTYSIQVNGTQGNIGQLPPPINLPNGYVNTGDEIGATQGTTADGVSEIFTVSTTLVTNVNFGMQQPPTAGHGSNTALNPGGTVSVNVPLGTFTNGDGTTASPSTDASGGTVSSIRITSMPTGATSITINGTTYGPLNPIPSAGVTIITNAAGLPIAGTTISVDPTALDGTTVTIPFVAVDNAGVASTNTGQQGKAVLNLSPLIISGVVYHDANGLGGAPANTVDGTPYTSGGITASLIGPDNLVIANVAASTTDGSFAFSGGIAAGTTYRVVLNTTGSVPVVGATILSGTFGTLPDGWLYTGEFIGALTTAGSDGMVNSNLAVPVTCCSVTTLKFGIRPYIGAQDDFYGPINPGATGYTTATSILVNDSIGTRALIPSEVTLTTVGAMPAGITLNASGTVTIASSVPGGTYTFNYQVCRNGFTPAVCDAATVSVVVYKPCQITATNPDTDGDGIANDCDLDDDNDGILDTDENACEASILAGYPGSMVMLGTTDFGYTSSGTDNQKGISVSKDISDKFGYPANSGAVVINIKNANVHPLNTPAPVNAFYVRGDLPPTEWTVTGSLATIIALEHGQTYYPNHQRSIIVNYNEPTLLGNNSGAGDAGWSSGVHGSTYYLRNLTGSNRNGILFLALMDHQPKKQFSFDSDDKSLDHYDTYFVRLATECDTDKDGIPNRLDPDSDNDGCFDAIEGGSSVALANVNGSGRITGGVGANGVPVLVGSGQSIGTSQNAGVKDPYCTPITISGSVHHDANGTIGGVDGPLISTPTATGGGTPEQLYAVLLTAAPGQPGSTVAQYAAVSGGSYSFSNVVVNTDYYVVLTTTAPTAAGTPAPAQTLPGSWAHVSSTDASPTNGYTAIPGTSTNVSGINFGIEQRPVANNVTWNVSGATENIAYKVGLESLDGDGNGEKNLNATDPEQGSIISGTKFQIVSVPKNAAGQTDPDFELRYNGNLIVDGTIIGNFNPALLTITFKTTSPPPVTSFLYKVADNAEVFSTAPATYTINMLSILPVTGLQLKASAVSAGKNNIEWQALTEANTSHFEVERSADGTRFEKIGTTKAAQNSNTLKIYSFTDDKAPSAIAYYRVRLVDQDGRTKLSNVAVASTHAQQTVKLLPNPAKSFVVVTGLKNGQQVTVSGIAGGLVLHKAGNGPTMRIELAGYAAGTYILQVYDNGKKVYTGRFIKQ